LYDFELNSIGVGMIFENGYGCGYGLTCPIVIPRC